MRKLIVCLLPFVLLAIFVSGFETAIGLLDTTTPSQPLSKPRLFHDSSVELHSPSIPTGLWVSEAIYAPKFFRGMGSHALRYDSQGYPHIVFGGDHLYYARHNGTVWQIQVVDESSESGMAASLTLDGDDRPHIAYQYNDYRPSGWYVPVLKYAHWDGNQWQILAIDTMRPMYGPAGIASVAVANTGLPHILYSDNGSYGSELRHAYWDGAQWQIELVAEHGYFHSLVLDTGGQPHISFYGGTYSSSLLYYAYKSGNAWQREVVAGGFPAPTDLILDSQGRPQVVYHDDYDVLKHSLKENGVWSTSIVNPDSRGGVSLAIDGNDTLTITYADAHLVYCAVWDGSQWVSDPVGVGPTTDSPTPSLALNSLDEPSIAYLNSDYELEISTFDQTQWKSEIIEEGGDVGGSPSVSMAVDEEGNPHALFFDRLRGRLYYAKWSEGGWVTTVVTDVMVSSVYVEPALSLALDGQDSPHVSYAIGSDTVDLVYANLTDPEWSFEVLDQVYYKSNTVAIDGSGNPHVAYCGGGRPHYARWSGASWLTATLNTGCFYGISLRLDSQDQPHIVFDQEQNLLYATWNGTAFESQTVDTGEYPYHLSLDLDSQDRPHIGYKFGSYVKYARLTDTGWLTEGVASQGMSYPYHGGSTSIRLDSLDTPSLAWCMYGYGVHYAVRGQTGWHAENVDNRRCIVTSPGQSTSLILDDRDQPLIGYHLALEGDLMFASRPVLDSHVYLPGILRKR